MLLCCSISRKGALRGAPTGNPLTTIGARVLELVLLVELTAYQAEIKHLLHENEQ